MNKTLIFDSGINTKAIKKLIKEIEEKEIKEDDEVTLYFSTSGGYTHSTDILVDYIRKNLKNLTIVCVGKIYSAGFSLLLKLKDCCNIQINETCTGMTHAISNEAFKNEKRIQKLKRYIKHNILKKQDYEYHVEKAISDENKKLKNLLINNLIEVDKVKNIENGEEIYFSNEEMVNIFTISQL